MHAYIILGIAFVLLILCLFWVRARFRGRPEGKSVEAPKKAAAAYANLRFYENEAAFEPDGAKIEDILTKWWGDYKKLESDSRYIQWLFPIYTRVKKEEPHELRKYEVTRIKQNPVLRYRVIKAYMMLLDFFGMKMRRFSTDVERAWNWEERFATLVRLPHFYVNITRILICLKIMGLKIYSDSFIIYLCWEIFQEDTLKNAKVYFYESWKPLLPRVLRKLDENIILQMYMSSDDTKPDKPLRQITSH